MTSVTKPQNPNSPASVRHQFSHNRGTYRYLGGSSLIRDIMKTPLLHSESASKVPKFPNPELDIEDIGVSPELHEYLVTNFLSGIHQVYPILDESSPYLLLDSATKSSNDAFALHMMYAISCLSSPEQPKLKNLGSSFYRRALRNIEKATVEPTIATLQVATLLALHSLLDPSNGNIGQHIAFAIRLSIGLADTDGPDQDPILWSLYPVVYALENTVATALDRINTFPEPTGPIEFVPTDPASFLCSLYRLQARFRNHVQTENGPTLNDALALIDTMGESVHPNVISTTLETQLLLQPSSQVAVRLIQSYEHPRFIPTFVTPHWTHHAGTLVKKDVDSKTIPRSDLLRAFGTAVSLLTKYSMRWPGVDVIADSLRNSP
ncbi:hypothetical protein FKW77_009984 [Venturia effusa]|uniref:Transcription factor domain-containing protein n=1 Tax=Venturia effusa TaxID=50376 RepID=A0A517L0A5_9PEZI|nr:hypothetical protein FKW77_009984 [Venturia effusa]